MDSPLKTRLAFLLYRYRFLLVYVVIGFSSILTEILLFKADLVDAAFLDELNQAFDFFQVHIQSSSWLWSLDGGFFAFHDLGFRLKTPKFHRKTLFGRNRNSNLRQKSVTGNMR